MFAFNGNSLRWVVLAHFHIYFSGRWKGFLLDAKILNTIETVKQQNLDTVGILEVLSWKQQQVIEDHLRHLWYKHILVYYGPHIKVKWHQLVSLLASKNPLQSLYDGYFPGGENDLILWHGWFIHAYDAQLKIHIFLVHVAQPLVSKKNKSLAKKQIKYIAKVCRKYKNERIILMWDFNKEYQLLQLMDTFYHKDVHIISNNQKTCSTNRFLKVFCNKAYDHIFINDHIYNFSSCWSFETHSDHKGLAIEIK